MAKPKGSPKTGGRKKGTPNKRTAVEKRALSAIVYEYFTDKKGYIKDLKLLEPRDRVNAMLRAARFVYAEPKDIDMTVTTTNTTLNDILKSLSNESN